MAYLLDADVFIRAKNLYYGFDFCPAFWGWLIAANADGKVLSIEKVGDEIQAVDDELSEWAKSKAERFFLPPNASVLSALSAVGDWASSQDYTASAINIFLQVADSYLVTQAVVGQHVVVTHEAPSASIRKIKIPDACIGLGIRWLTPFEMLRNDGRASCSDHRRDRPAPISSVAGTAIPRRKPSAPSWAFTGTANGGVGRRARRRVHRHGVLQPDGLRPARYPSRGPSGSRAAARTPWLTRARPAHISAAPSQMPTLWRSPNTRMPQTMPDTTEM